MKAVIEIDCDGKYCKDCKHEWEGLCTNNFFERIICHFDMCTKYIKLRKTKNGYMRCKLCLAATAEYEMLDALKTCNNCCHGPLHACLKSKNCSRGIYSGKDDIWSGK